MGNTHRKGIDVSSHNGLVNFEAVKAAGIDFIILRAGYGSDDPGQDDAQFERCLLYTSTCQKWWSTICSLVMKARICPPTARPPPRRAVILP